MNIELNHSKWKEYNFNDIFTEYSKTNTENLEQFTVGKYGLTTKLTDICSYNIQNHKVFEPNTLLIGIGAEEVGVSVTERGCVSPIYNTFKISNDFDSLFLKYLMPIIILQNKYKISHISTRRDYEIETSKLSKIKILLPSFEIQKEISRLLYLVDNEIASQEMILTKLKQLKQSLLELLFPSNNSNFPRLRFKNFTSPWEQRKVQNVAFVSTGFPFDSKDFSDDGDFLVITNGNIQDAFPVVDDSLGNRVSVYDNKIKSAYLLNIGDILVTMDGTVGRTARVIMSGQILAQRVGRLKAFNNSNFLYQWLNTGTFSKEMSTLSHGGTIKHISLNEIRSYEAMMPQNSDEQEKIGEYFNSLDNLITLHQCKLKKYKEIKSALLDKLLI